MLYYYKLIAKKPFCSINFVLFLDVLLKIFRMQIPTSNKIFHIVIPVYNQIFCEPFCNKGRRSKMLKHDELVDDGTLSRYWNVEQLSTITTRVIYHPWFPSDVVGRCLQIYIFSVHSPARWNKGDNCLPLTAHYLFGERVILKSDTLTKYIFVFLMEVNWVKGLTSKIHISVCKQLISD